MGGAFMKHVLPEGEARRFLPVSQHRYRRLNKIKLNCKQDTHTK